MICGYEKSEFALVTTTRSPAAQFVATFCVFMSISASWSQAADITIQNDSIPPGTPLTQFISGERVAAWLTMPMAGDIVGVELFWSSQFGSAPASIETAITISAAGTFPTPGAVLATITAPTLLDAGSNVFSFLDPPTNSLPVQVPVSAGQVVVVDLQFLNTNSGNVFAPSIEFDSDGCQIGKNSVLAIPGGWADACALGVTGDLGIRAILRPVPEPTGTWIVFGLVLRCLARRHWFCNLTRRRGRSSRKYRSD